MNAIHVRDQKHELTPPRNRYPCDNGYKEVTAFPPRDIVYDQDIKLVNKMYDYNHLMIGLWAYSNIYLPGQDPLSLFETSPFSSCLDISSKHQNRRRSKEGAIKEKESRNNHKGPKLAWSILDILIRFVLKHLGAECTFIRLGADSSLITSLLIMLVMTCTLVSCVGGLEMHLEAELHIFRRLIQSN
ncbi:hypothetical protein GQ457_03G021380 [Hibiscus cannabinus]